jgi:hypothetical protein
VLYDEDHFHISIRPCIPAADAFPGRTEIDSLDYLLVNRRKPRAAPDGYLVPSGINVVSTNIGSIAHIDDI